MTNAERWVSWLVVLGLVGNSGAAIAEPGSRVADNGSNSMALAPVTVTANKMEEDVRKVPMSVQVITGEQLEEAGVRSVRSLLNRIPNMTVSRNYGVFTSPNYRGLNTSRFSQESPVTIYVDGIPNNSTYGMDLGLANIDRVEVLRGSQSTLYGQNAIGGVINIITRKSKRSFNGHGTAEVGEDGHQSLSASAGGEVIEDTLSLNLAARYQGRDGFLKNSLPGSRKHIDEADDRQLNARMDWRVSDALQVKLVLDSQRQDNGALPMVGGNGARDHSAQEVDSFNRVDTDQQSLNVRYDMGTMEATYLISNQRTDIEHQSDLDRTSGTMNDGAFFFDRSKVTTTGHELRLAGQKGAGRWVTGLYYLDSLYDAIDNGLTMPGALDSHLFTNVHGEQYSAFGQMTLPVGSQLEATLGLRYQYDNKHTDFENLNVMMGQSMPTAYTRGASWNVWLPKAALAFNASDSVALYGSVSRGYLPGGFNFTEVNPEASKFDPQLSTDFELGIKTTWWDRRLQADINLFYLDIKDAHGVSIDAMNQLRTFNVDESSSWGAEIDLQLLLEAGWTANAALGYNQAEYGSGEFDGRDVPYTPRKTASIGMSYNTGAGVFVSLDYLYRSSSYNDAANTLRLGGYGVFNGRLGYQWRDISVYAFGRNLFDREYITNLYSLPLPGTEAIRTIGEPQTFGAGVRVTF